ncbi:MAG TPA: MFS transporter [Burkholderiales bacterium]|nr:MFS transporter [Burkholderiales bacterium]
MAIRLTLALGFFLFTGLNAARIVLTLYALELGAPPSVVGVLGFLFYLFALLLSWPVGALADRAGAYRLLVFAAACNTAALVLPFFVRTLPAFYLAAALSGLALAFFHVTLQNTIGLLSTPAERPRNFSNFSMMGAVTNFVGPLFAGFSIDHAGHATACLYGASLSLVALALVMAWGRRLLPPGDPGAKHGIGSMNALADREVARMLATSSLVQLGTDLFQFYLPIYGHSIGLSASAIGTVLSAFAVASFIVRMFLARLVEAVRGEKLLAWSFYLGTIGFVLVPFCNNAYTLGATAFFFGLGMGVAMPLTVILMYERTVAGRAGQTLGMRLTVNNFMRAIGPLVFGAVGSAFGLPPVFWINGAMMMIGGLMSRTPRKGARADV